MSTAEWSGILGDNWQLSGKTLRLSDLYLPQYQGLTCIFGRRSGAQAYAHTCIAAACRLRNIHGANQVTNSHRATDAASPPHLEKLFNQRNTLVFVLLLTLWRLYLSAELQLHPDEAYYWLWSRHLDMGYFDHSPLVGYFIWFTTLLAKSELWVRLSGTIVSLIVSYLTWKLALQLFGSVVVASGSVMLFNIYPLTMLGLIVITPDIPVFLFWSLSVYIFWQIMRTGQTWLWYVLGLSFGLALLSKYTAILLAPSLLLYLLVTDDRRWLKTFYPYVSMLIGLACFLPVVYWNSQHDWISFAFQFKHGLGNTSYSLSQPLEYVAGQLIVAGPVIWFLGMYAALVCLLRKNKAQLFLILTSLPVILFFGVTSVSKLAGPNWSLFAYFSFSICVTRYFLDGGSRARRALWYAALIGSLFVSAVMTLHARFGIVPLAKFSTDAAVADTTNWFYGWRELGAELMKHPEMDFAIAPSHQLSAEIIYYTDEKLFVQVDEKVARPSQFNLWPWPDGFKGKNGLYVWTHDDAPGPYGEYFGATSAINTLTISRGGVDVRGYSIVAGKGSRIPPFAAR
jgi:undecaprenyl-diphosphatase